MNNSVKRTVDNKRNCTEEVHESFGVISASRITGGSIRLFGSMIDSLPSCIELRIRHAARTIDHRLHTEHYHHNYELPYIAILQISTYQWAELLSGMNGIEIPCTMKYCNGKRISEVPAEVTTPLEQIKQDASKGSRSYQRESTDNFREDINKLSLLIDGTNLSIKKKDELKVALRKLYSDHISDPLVAAEWAAQRLAEDTEKLTSQARIEVAAAVSSLVTKVGIKTLEERGVKLLQQPEEEKTLLDLPVKREFNDI
jgi:hypothetical protein